MKKIYNLLALFIITYALALPTWLATKTTYNTTLTNFAFSLACYKYDFKIDATHATPKEIHYTISNKIPIKDYAGNTKQIQADITMITEWITRNVPMTLALLIAITLAYKRTKPHYIAIGITALIALHLATLIVISLSVLIASSMESTLIHFYLSRFSTPSQTLYYIGTFLGNYAYLFEPFLIAFATWAKLR